MLSQRRVSVIGTGKWGKVLIEKFNKLGALHVVHGSSNRTKLERLEVTFLNDVDSLIYSSDAVVVATNPETHFLISKKVLEEGKDLLVEKPIALSSSEAEELAQLAQEKQVILMVGHTLCYSKLFADMLALEGVPIKCEAIFFKKHEQEDPINAYWNLGVHMIAMAELLGLSKHQIELQASDSAPVDKRLFKLTIRSDDGQEKTYEYDFLKTRKDDDMLLTECKEFIRSITDKSVPLTSGWHGARTLKILEHFSPAYVK